MAERGADGTRETTLERGAAAAVFSSVRRERRSTMAVILPNADDVSQIINVVRDGVDPSRLVRTSRAYRAIDFLISSYADPRRAYETAQRFSPANARRVR